MFTGNTINSYYQDCSGDIFTFSTYVLKGHGGSYGNLQFMELCPVLYSPKRISLADLEDNCGCRKTSAIVYTLYL